jgi:hypothetical protein
MKFELLLFGLTGFLVYNTYYDNRILDLIHSNMKYIHIGTYLLMALTLYVLYKKIPGRTSKLLVAASELVKYMPSNKNGTDYFTPLINMTKEGFLADNQNIHHNPNIQSSGGPQFKRMMNSGRKQTNKRSVSETKKKYVASKQGWSCGHCHQPLDHTFEVDHIQDLQYGGDNSVDNLIALCRNCHGVKTANSKL